MTHFAGASVRASLLRSSQPGRARALLLSAVDEVLLDGRAARRDVAAGLDAVSRHADLVLVSSRTVEELIYLLHELGAEADLIAESGACTAVRSPAIARNLGATETLLRRGRRWYVASPGAPVAEVRTSVARARAEHEAAMRLAPELSRQRRMELLGGLHAARLALSRRCSVLLEPPADGAATDACVEALRSAGCKAVIGAQWLAVWRGPDAGEAASAYLAARRTAGFRPAGIGAIGAADGDAALLRAASLRYVVRVPGGQHDPSLLALPGAVAVAAAGPAGWFEAAAQLIGQSSSLLLGRSG